MPLRPVHCWARSRVRPISPALRGVGGLRQPGGGQAEHAADVDDGAAGPHDLRARLRHPVATVEVELDDRPELIGRLAGSGNGGADAGIVDQDVDASERVDRSVDQRLALSGSVTSVRTATALRPADLTSAAVSASRSSRRAPSTTSAPASARACANATPRPLDAPVTIATRPSMRKRSRMVIAWSLSGRECAVE